VFANPLIAWLGLAIILFALLWPGPRSAWSMIRRRWRGRD